LKAIGTADAWLVVWEDDPDDWLVRFACEAGFPAETWARNMARLYNERRSAKCPALLPVGSRPASFNPETEERHDEGDN
jgi:hypothetical protein